MKGDKFVAIVAAAAAAHKDTKTGDLKKSVEESHSYEEALKLAGNGTYNLGLLAVLSVVLLSMGLDMFSFSVLVTGCSCEFQLTQSQKGILNSIPFGGPVLTAYMWGYISDTQGRRRSLLVGMTLSCLFSALCTLSPNWMVLGLFKFIATSMSSSAQSATFTLLGESCSPETSRTYMLVMSSVLQATPILYFGLAYFILGQTFSYDLGFIHYTPWRLYGLILTTPLLLGSVLLLFFFESPKFLANKGEEKAALEVLKKIYKRNGGDPDEYQIKKIVLEDQTSRKDVAFLQSVWEQCVPLFQPPLLTRTLLLFFLTAVIYGSSNSFTVWFPFVANAFFSSLRSGGSGSTSLCDLLNLKDPGLGATGNITDVSVQCISKLDDYTVFSGVGVGIVFMMVNLCLAAASARKKILTILIFSASCCGALGVLLTPEPVSAIFFYLLFSISILGIGMVSSYYVELFPTSHRGMVACLSVVVARVSALCGINIVGAFIRTSCQATFIGGLLYVFCGVMMACFLPSDRSPKKC